MLYPGTGHPKSFCTLASLGERIHYLPILSLLCHLGDQPLNNRCTEILNFASTAFHCIFINKHMTILTVDCQILPWKDFSTPSIVHLPAKGYRLVAHTDVNGLPQQEAFLESFSPASQDATKHMTELQDSHRLSYSHRPSTICTQISLSELCPTSPLSLSQLQHTWLLNVFVSVQSHAWSLTHALGQEHLHSFCISKTSPHTGEWEWGSQGRATASLHNFQQRMPKHIHDTST